MALIALVLLCSIISQLLYTVVYSRPGEIGRDYCHFTARLPRFGITIDLHSVTLGLLVLSVLSNRRPIWCNPMTYTQHYNTVAYIYNEQEIL